MISKCPGLQRLKKMIPKLAASAEPLVIVGESGVGKSLLASHIHARSERNGRRLVILNCRTLNDRDQRIPLLGGGPPELSTTRRSVLEQPTTVLIKNIDSSARYLQDALAAVLKNKKLFRPGDKDPRPLQARLIFSLCALPEALRKKNQLTPALHGFLRGVRSLSVPPLRSRKADHTPLLKSLAPNPLPQSLIHVVQRHTWPGNITELKSYLRSIVVVSYEEALREYEKRELAKMILLVEEGKEFSLPESLTFIEQGIIKRAYNRNDSHQARTARMLGLSDRDIRRKLAKLL